MNDKYSGRLRPQLGLISTDLFVLLLLLLRPSRHLFKVSMAETDRLPDTQQYDTRVGALGSQRRFVARSEYTNELSCPRLNWHLLEQESKKW